MHHFWSNTINYRNVLNHKWWFFLLTKSSFQGHWKFLTNIKCVLKYLRQPINHCKFFTKMWKLSIQKKKKKKIRFAWERDVREFCKSNIISKVFRWGIRRGFAINRALKTLRWLNRRLDNIFFFNHNCPMETLRAPRGICPPYAICSQVKIFPRTAVPLQR